MDCSSCRPTVDETYREGGGSEANGSIPDLVRISMAAAAGLPLRGESLHGLDGLPASPALCLIGSA